MPRTVYSAALNALAFLPYAHGLLRAYAVADEGVASEFEFASPFFVPEPLEAIVERVERPAVLALSCYVWNFRRHIKLARLVKASHPETLVVAGGPHVPDRA